MSNLVPIADVLADAEVFTDGDWVESKDQDADGDVRLTQLADVGDGNWINKSARFLTSERAEHLRCTYLKSGDLLVARMPDPLGRGCIFPGDPMPCVTVVDVCVIRPNRQKIDNEYLMHVINSPHGRQGIARYITGTTRQRISRKNLGKVQIPVPPLAEQKRIAGILDAADALRAKRRESLAQLGTLLQSTFLDMFGDPVTNPMGWDAMELAELVEEGTIVTYGIVQAGKEYPGGVPYIRTGDIVDGEIQIDGLRHTDPAIAAKFERSRVRAGEIVMSIRATVGTTAFVPEKLDGANLTQGTARISPGIASAPAYLLHYLRSDGTQRWIQRQVKGATFREITLKRLRQLPVLIPSLDLQHRFAAIVESVEKQKARQRAHLAELDILFASLQSRAFRGDL